LLLKGGAWIFAMAFGNVVMKCELWEVTYWLAKPTNRPEHF